MIKTVIKLFSIGYRRVFQGNLGTSLGGGEGREELRRSGTWNKVVGSHNLQNDQHATLVSGIFKQLTTFVVVPDVLSKFLKIDNLFFFR